MKKLLLLLTLILSFSAFAQPTIEWQRSLGGSYWENAYSIQQTTDGGYIVAGWSDSNDGDVSGNNGISDFWIVKLDASGNISWQNSLGGSLYDVAYNIQQTTDGGYIVAGWSESNDGDVSGNNGGYDYWIVKLDAVGNLSWQRALGGSDFDLAYSIQQTTDGGYIVAGYTDSNNGDVSGNNGGKDYWIVKLDASGNLSWQKCLGGSGDEGASSIQQTTDGGYIVAGWSESNDGDVSGNNGTHDYWIVKLDASGNLSWQKSLGGSNTDLAYSIQQTTDGGYIVAGYTDSNNGDVSGNNGGVDYWIVKLNASGNIIWQRSLGSSGLEVAYSMHQTTDGGYIVAGWSDSNDGDVTVNNGGNDYWIVKLDASGNISWEKSLGGSGNEVAYSIRQTTDGGYIVAGWSDSNDGDVSGSNGFEDFWIVKLGPFDGIEELINPKKELIKIIDFMGRETEFKPNIPLIFIYSDGTQERVMEVEE
jgi:hypothetical protein